MSSQILAAATIITMDPARPRADAVAVTDGLIAAVGTLDECRAACPDAEVLDTGARALLPGFVEPHSHPVMSGVATQPPARAVSPWVAPTWADVEAIIAEAIATTDPAKPLLFAGFDALLHGRPSPRVEELDRIFGERVAVITDNSGHGAYFNTAVMKVLGWDVNPPADPVGGHYGRNADGSLNGQGFETAAIMEIAAPVLAQLGGNPLLSAARYYATMARAGYTSTSDMTYDRRIKTAYETLAAAPSCPLRVSMWEMSTSDSFADPEYFAAGEAMLVKSGVKLWTDGSPWIGNIATSFPYLSNDTTVRAGIDPAVAGGARSLNYSREQLDATLDAAVPAGWQMAFHANGDLAIDLALDAYEAALRRHNLTGTDHRWRLEHLGAGTRTQFERAAALGVYVSMAPFQYYYWGDLLDGKLFDQEHGSRWQAFGDAVNAGAVVSLHNDGSVSPPTPVLNIQTAVTRRTRAGNVHGTDQSISLDQAMRAHTVDAARTLRRENLVGSLSVGKLADFTELSADPYTVDPTTLADTAQVTGTWLSGKRIDLEAFLGAIEGVDPAAHTHLSEKAHRICC